MIKFPPENKPAILAALYNASRPQGMGYLEFDPDPMTEKQAAELLEKTKRFDYLKGRVLKINLEDNEFDPWLYDRDNGNGAAQDAVAHLLTGADFINGMSQPDELKK